MSRIIPEEYHCKGWFCKAFSHWLNPLGNWNEPLPYPEHRKQQAEQSWLPPAVWWNLRNPFHNFCHYWVGITPRGQRYEWIDPEEKGWVRVKVPAHSLWQYSFWTRKGSKIKLPHWYYNGEEWEFYIGWLSRGNFGMALRKRENKSAA